MSKLLIVGVVIGGILLFLLAAATSNSSTIGSATGPSQRRHLAPEGSGTSRFGPSAARRRAASTESRPTTARG